MSLKETWLRLVQSYTHLQSKDSVPDPAAPQNVFSYYRMRSLTVECVLSLSITRHLQGKDSVPDPAACRQL